MMRVEVKIPEKALSKHRGHIPTDGGSDGEQSLCRRDVSFLLSKLVTEEHTVMFYVIPILRNFNIPCAASLAKNVF